MQGVDVKNEMPFNAQETEDFRQLVKDIELWDQAATKAKYHASLGVPRLSSHERFWRVGKVRVAVRHASGTIQFENIFYDTEKLSDWETGTQVDAGPWWQYMRMQKDQIREKLALRQQGLLEHVEAERLRLEQIENAKREKYRDLLS